MLGLPGARRRLRGPAAVADAPARRVLRPPSAVARSYVDEARRRVGPKRARIGPIIERLTAEHPDAAIALRFRSPLELLVSVMLSAQTTDVNVNRVTARLFAKYRRPEDYLAVPAGGARARHLRDRLLPPEGEVAARDDAHAARGVRRARSRARLEELLRLPGVARKTANVVAAELGEPQGVVVDTHVRRLSQRLGLTRQEDPVKIERDLQKLVPREDWGAFPHLLIWHGRRVCDARRPRCERCVLTTSARRAGSRSQRTFSSVVTSSGATRRPPSES